MPNRHVIGKQSLEIQVVGKTQAHTIQQKISALYWQKLAPAFEHLFNCLAGPDELVRLGKVEISLSALSLQDLLSDDFVKKLLAALETVINRERSTTAQGTVVQSLRMGYFDLWLYFLEQGSLPAFTSAPESIPEWHRHIFDTLALEQYAVEQLRQLVAISPSAMERLVLQYDGAFLQQIITLFTGIKHDKLSDSIQEIIVLISKPAATKASPEHHESAQLNKEIVSITEAIFVQLLLIFPFLQSDSRQEIIKKKLTQILKQKITGNIDIRQILSNSETWRVVLAGVTTSAEQLAALNLFPEIPGSHFRKAKSKISKVKKTNISPPSQVPLQSEIDELWAAVAAYFARPEFQKLLHKMEEVRTLFRQKMSNKKGKNLSAVVSHSVKALRQFEIEVWRVMLFETIVRHQKAETSDLIGIALSHKSMVKWELVIIESLERAKPNRNSILKHLPSKLKTPAIDRANEQVQKTEEKPAIELPINALSKKEDTFFILHAGLVLLHPFVPTLFRTLELLEGTAFKDNWSQQKAVCLFHFLATGEIQAPEYQLTLPKFLCGLPFNMPIDHTISISPEEQEECEHLLKAAIGHSGVLGSTSPDGLREGFLQREGKLSNEQTGWLLRVERKTLDILLDRLPWGIGMIKLPWMDEVLKVEWT